MKLRVHIGQSDRKRRSPAWWPHRSDGRVRVLLEYPANAAPPVMVEVLEEAGYEPLVCEGSDGCPMSAGLGCSLVDGADVVGGVAALVRPSRCCSRRLGGGMMQVRLAGSCGVPTWSNSATRVRPCQSEKEPQ